MNDVFIDRLEDARKRVTEARAADEKQVLADALKALGNIERRPPFLRDAALQTYSEAARIYHELGITLDEAWVKRHIGIIHEYADHLDEAEKYYEEALSLYRTSAGENSLDFANAVRYLAVIKNRLRKREESSLLWEEAVDRYTEASEPLGVAEAAAWLTIFAIEAEDRELALSWFQQAKAASDQANDEDTFGFIGDVARRLKEAGFDQ